MPRVQIHCYGCDATVAVATSRSSEDLHRAGWALAHGETYCPKCAPARVPALVASTEQGDDAVNAGDDLEGRCEGVAASIAASEHAAARPPRSGFAASTLARLPWPRSGPDDGDGAEPHLPGGRTAAGILLSALQLPFRRPHAPVTSRSKVSSQTIVLFCIAAALTLATLGSEHMAIRLPGVLFSFAAGLSWLHDLRSSA